MNVAEAMHSGRIYDPADPQIAREQQLCLDLLYDYNMSVII